MLAFGPLADGLGLGEFLLCLCLTFLVDQIVQLLDPLGRPLFTGKRLVLLDLQKLHS